MHFFFCFHFRATDQQCQLPYRQCGLRRFEPICSQKANENLAHDPSNDIWSDICRIYGCTSVGHWDSSLWHHRLE